MAPLNNSRLAWSVAVAALALWATSAPVTWGQLSTNATRLLDVPPTSTASDDSQQADETVTPCPPAPDSVAVPAEVDSLSPTPAPPPPAASSSSQASFHVCGADPSAAQAIEQLIAGRNFSARMSTTADGCADLTVQANAPVGRGSATSRLSVALGSGQNLEIEITSENGATHVSITSGA